MTAPLVIEEVIKENPNCVIRVDWNVDYQGGKITDFSRIEESMDAIKTVLSNGGRIALISHLVAPEDDSDVPSHEVSFSVIIDELKEYLFTKHEIDLGFISCEGMISREENFSSEYWAKVKRDFNEGKEEIFLLDNIRMHKGEMENCSQELTKLLWTTFACKGKIFTYINEAFACSHRKHASMSKLGLVMMEGYFRQLCELFIGHNMYRDVKMMGYLEEEETTLYDKLSHDMLIVGGAKVQDKIKLLSSVSYEKLKYLVIGGLLANPFLKYLRDFDVPDVDECCRSYVIKIASQALECGCKIILPMDKEPNSDIPFIGDNTVHMIKNAIEKSTTVVWNGAISKIANKELSIQDLMNAGVANLDDGTDEEGNKPKGKIEPNLAIAMHLAAATSQCKITSILGGGSICQIIKMCDEIVPELDMKSAYSYVTSGGGAMLSHLIDDNIQILLINYCTLNSRARLGKSSVDKDGYYIRLGS